MPGELASEFEVFHDGDFSINSIYTEEGAPSSSLKQSVDVNNDENLAPQRRKQKAAAIPKAKTATTDQEETKILLAWTIVKMMIIVQY